MFPRRAGLPIGAFVADLFGRSGRSWSLPQVQSVTGATAHPGLEGHEGLQNRLSGALACYPSQGVRLPLHRLFGIFAKQRYQMLEALPVRDALSFRPLDKVVRISDRDAHRERALRIFDGLSFLRPHSQCWRTVDEAEVISHAVDLPGNGTRRLGLCLCWRRGGKEIRSCHHAATLSNRLLMVSVTSATKACAFAEAAGRPFTSPAGSSCSASL